MKNEFQVIADLIEKDKKVLDVGCADGTLMKFLKDNKNINIRGCLLYTSPSPRDLSTSRMPSSA